MKNSFKRVISVILSVFMMFSASTFAFAADGEAADNSALIAVAGAINGLLEAVFDGFGSLFPNNFKTVDEYYAGESENFYEGTAEFIDSPAEGARWQLGFGEASIVPENLKSGAKKYYTGGYFTQQISGVYDDQGVNAIALSDNSNRGTVIMASIDGIGVNNADIRAIRAEVERKLLQHGIFSDIVAININSTHCHTVIDTQGFSLELIGKVFQNLFSFLPFIEATRSINKDFLEIMIDGASDAIVEAYLNMEFGELYYYETAKIGKSEQNGVYLDDEYAYLHNKRYKTEGFQNFFACFKFVPDNAESKPTVFTNIGAHPTTIDRATSLLSADFPAYMEEKINAAGMNFVFVQGAQSPISVQKSAVQTEEIVAEIEAQIAADPKVADYRAAKSLGYEFAGLILEAEESAAEVAPVINVRMAECTVPLDNGLLQLGATAQLLGTTTVYDDKSASGYSIITEVGYVELGTDIVMLTVPGELIPQLVYGNVVDKTEAYLGTDWEIDCTAKLLKDKKVLVMGLCNDAIGYIIPDNDYAPFIADSLWDSDLGEKLFGTPHRHYEETLTTGSKAASSVMTALNAVVNEIK